MQRTRGEPVRRASPCRLQRRIHVAAADVRGVAPTGVASGATGAASRGRSSVARPSIRQLARGRWAERLAILLVRPLLVDGHGQHEHGATGESGHEEDELVRALCLHRADDLVGLGHARRDLVGDRRRDQAEEQREARAAERARLLDLVRVVRHRVIIAHSASDVRLEPDLDALRTNRQARGDHRALRVGRELLDAVARARVVELGIVPGARRGHLILRAAACSLPPHRASVTA